MVKLLLRYGADCHVRNMQGHTPAEVAYRHGYRALGDFITGRVKPLGHSNWMVVPGAGTKPYSNTNMCAHRRTVNPYLAVQHGATALAKNREWICKENHDGECDQDFRHSDDVYMHVGEGTIYDQHHGDAERYSHVQDMHAHMHVDEGKVGVNRHVASAERLDRHHHHHHLQDMHVHASERADHASRHGGVEGCVDENDHQICSITAVAVRTRDASDHAEHVRLLSPDADPGQGAAAQRSVLLEQSVDAYHAPCHAHSKDGAHVIARSTSSEESRDSHFKERYTSAVQGQGGSNQQPQACSTSTHVRASSKVMRGTSPILSTIGGSNQQTSACPTSISSPSQKSKHCASPIFNMMTNADEHSAMHVERHVDDVRKESHAFKEKFFDDQKGSNTCKGLRRSVRGNRARGSLAADRQTHDMHARTEAHSNELDKYLQIFSACEVQEGEMQLFDKHGRFRPASGRKLQPSHHAGTRASASRVPRTIRSGGPIKARASPSFSSVRGHQTAGPYQLPDRLYGVPDYTMDYTEYQYAFGKDSVSRSSSRHASPSRFRSPTRTSINELHTSPGRLISPARMSASEPHTSPGRSSVRTSASTSPQKSLKFSMDSARGHSHRHDFVIPPFNEVQKGRNHGAKGLFFDYQSGSGVVSTSRQPSPSADTLKHVCRRRASLRSFDLGTPACAIDSRHERLASRTSLDSSRDRLGILTDRGLRHDQQSVSPRSIYSSRERIGTPTSRGSRHDQLSVSRGSPDSSREYACADSESDYVLHHAVCMYGTHHAFREAFDRWQRHVQVEKLVRSLRGAPNKVARYACLDCYSRMQPCERHSIAGGIGAKKSYVMAPKGGLENVRRIVRMLVLLMSMRAKARPLLLRMAIVCEARWRGLVATALQHWCGCARTKHAACGVLVRHVVTAWSSACQHIVHRRECVRIMRQTILERWRRRVYGRVAKGFRANVRRRVGVRILRRRRLVCCVFWWSCAFASVYICVYKRGHVGQGWYIVRFD